MNFAKFRDERQAFHLSLQGKITKQEEKCANWPNCSQLADDVELRNCEGSWIKSTPTSQISRESLHLRTVSRLTDRAKHAADRPLTDAAQQRNDNLRSELFTLRSEQMTLSHEVEDLKKERQAVMDQAVSNLPGMVEPH